MYQHPWPLSGNFPTIALNDVPPRTLILGLGPIGVRWEARKTKDSLKPAGNCPTEEFLPCFALCKNQIYEILNIRKPNEPKDTKGP